MKTFVLTTSLLLAASCPVPPNPQPTPTPDPTPTPVNMQGPKCADNNLNCDCIDFPPPGNPTCVICDSSSPTGTKSIGVVPVCPPVGPTPEPTTTPTPVPGTCSIPDSGATVVTPRPAAQFSDVLNTTLQELYGGTPQSRVPIPVDMNTSLNQVVNALKAKGICAGIQAGADEVCIFIAPNKCQGYHTFTCDPGCTSGVVGWAPGSVRDTWVGPVTPNPVPTPTPTPPNPNPTPTPACPSLTNLKVNSHQTSSTSWVVDVTPRGPDCARCASINKSCDNGVCPLGPEGTPEFDAQRVACETLNGLYSFWLIGTRADLTTYNGPCNSQDTCFHQSDNPLSVKVNGHGQVTVKAGLTGLTNSVVIP